MRRPEAARAGLATPGRGDHLGAMTEIPEPDRAALAFLERMFAAEMAFVAAEDGDVATLADAFDPDVVVHEPQSLPYPGDWRGYDGLARLFAAMRETWSDMAVDGLRATRSGDTIFMTCTLRLVSRASGREVAQPFAEVLRLKDGRLVEGTPFYFDTAALLAAIG